MSYHLTLGQRAATSARGPVRIPIEGSRAVVDQGTLTILTGIIEPTKAERHITEHGALALAVFAKRAVVAVAFHLGQSIDEMVSLAAVDLLDPDAEPGGFLDVEGGLTARGEYVPMRFVLCDSDTGEVVAVRHVSAPPELVEIIRKRGRIQVKVCASSSAVRQASAVATADVIPERLLDSKRTRIALVDQTVEARSWSVKAAPASGRAC